MINNLLVFISAFLLFVIQPSIAKTLLPYTGGSSLCWVISLIFFQLMLFLGYSLNSFISKTNKITSFLTISFLFISGSFLFNTININNETFSSLGLNLFYFLVLKLGSLSILLGFTSPFIQKLIDKKNSYSLYSISNTGSLGALLLYPFLIESNLSLTTQLKLFNYGSFIFFILLCYSIYKLKNQNFVKKENKDFIIHHKLKIFTLSAITNSLLIIVTNNLSLKFAEAPFIWIIPLLIFLSVYILAFLEKEIINFKIISRLKNYSLIILPIFLLFNIKLNFSLYIITLSTLYFIILYSLIREIYNLRPKKNALDKFYIYLSLGGLTGSILTGIIFQILFNHLAEIFVVFSCIYLLNLSKKDTPFILIILLTTSLSLLNPNFVNINQKILISLYALTLVLSLKLKQKYFLTFLSVLLFISLNYLNNNLKYKEVLSSRNLYGIKKIKSKNNFNFFFHGNTIHGIQNTLDQDKVYTYASKNSGIYEVIDKLKIKEKSLNVLVIGLGIGHIASYSRETDFYTFIELDPQVVSIAKNKDYFTYLNNCKNCKTIIGDGRIKIAKLNTKFDLIFIDAFTSGNIPLHLLTKEGLEIYFSKLEDDGLIAFNISHTYLDLNKALIANSNNLGFKLITKGFNGEIKKYNYPNIYSVIAKNNNKTLELLNKRKEWDLLMSNENNLWSDNFSNLFSILKD